VYSVQLLNGILYNINIYIYKMGGNNFKILHPFDKNGTELKTWLDANKSKLANQRIFYILRAKMEKNDVFKIGISERGGQSAYGRLKDYYHFYGQSNQGGCYGVKIHLILANTFDPNVQTSDSNVRRVETKMKAAPFKKARGSERLEASISDIYEYMKEHNLLNVKEDSNPVRQTPRLKELGQSSTDTVKQILGHNLPKTRSGQIKYTTEFAVSIRYDRNNKPLPAKKMPNKELTYDQLVQLRNGRHLADEYNKKHNLN